MYVPKWFVKEMQNTIDARYYVVPHPETQTYHIVLDADVLVTSPFRGAFRITGPKTVDVFKDLGSTELNQLRYRKWLGRQMRVLDRPNAEWEFIMAQEKAAKEKEMRLAHEMMAEGLMEGYRLDRKHTVS